MEQQKPENEKPAKRNVWEEFRQQAFGNVPQGNIWGKNFTIFSAVLIITFAILAGFLHYTGRVDIRTGRPPGAPATDSVQIGIGVKKAN